MPLKFQGHLCFLSGKCMYFYSHVNMYPFYGEFIDLNNVDVQDHSKLFTVFQTFVERILRLRSLQQFLNVLVNMSQGHTMDYYRYSCFQTKNDISRG